MRADIDLIGDRVDTERVTPSVGGTAVTRYKEQAIGIAQFGGMDICVLAGCMKRADPTAANPSPWPA